MERDIIKIDNLEVYAYHGVLPAENELGQKFYVNAQLEVDLRPAGLKDELHLSVNYGEVCHFIHDYMTNNRFKLIEAIAEQMAEEVLLHYKRVTGITLEIRKPQAPIGLAFESVSVCVHRQWHRTYIACGSNLGEREQFIESAVRSMCNHPSCRVLQESELLQSTPYGMEEQGEFVNGVVEMDTLLPPMELLDYLHTLEQIAGRERTAHWGPRTLDLDILLYDDFIIDTETLTIPHPDMSNRDFVLQPLAELAGYMRHPLTHLTIQEMLTDLQRRMIAHIKQ